MAVLAKDLRAAVLQAAIQGKLTKQLPEDGGARDLLTQIKAEKEQLIKDKKIKKEKPLAPIDEDKIPFDIPDNWCWVHLGDIFTHNSGKALNAKDTKGTLRKYLTTSNVYWEHFELDNLKEMYYTDDEIEKYSVRKGDLLVLEGGDVGRTAIWDRDDSYCIQNHIHRLRPYVDVCIKYFYYSMMYLKMNNEISGKGIGIKGLSSGALHCILITLPPLAEQHRIVARIEELMSLIDEYEKIEKQLEELKEKFPGDMKAALLQAAIQGKLTKQLNSDSKVAIEDKCFEINIDIPQTWITTSIDAVLSVRTGLAFNKDDKITSEQDGIRVFRGGNIFDNFNYKILPDDIFVKKDVYEAKCDFLKEGDIITPSVTSMEKMCKAALIDKDLPDTVAGGFVFQIRVLDTNIILPKYALYYLSSEYHKTQCKPNIKKSGQAFYNLRKTGFEKQPFIIPPIEEQQRIVDILDKLLPLCDELA